MEWEGSIGCDGGPVIVANAEDFEHWTGSNPLPADERRELHLWSTFTGELPERFRPAGTAGHQFIPGRDPAHLVELRRELLEYVEGRWPGTKTRQGFETWIVRRPDGAELRLELAPTSEYDRCTRDLAQLALHRFDGDRTALVWSVEPGTVSVRRPLSRRLELAQVSFADDEQSADRAMEHGRQAPSEHLQAETRFVIKEGQVVVSWAPNAAGDLRRRLDWRRLGPTGGGRILDLATGASGALIWIAPGTWRAAVGEHETATWGVRWCVLTSA